jgi:hypothetical protein
MRMSVNTDILIGMAIELLIPERAQAALAVGDTELAVRLSLAAELRRLASDEMSYAPACRLLEARADELDPRARR